MNTTVLVHTAFDGNWPLAADHLRALLDRHQEAFRFSRSDSPDRPPAGQWSIERPEAVSHLVCLGVPLTAKCLQRFSALKNVFAASGPLDSDALDAMKQRGINLLRHPSEGYWGQSVAEFALALTLCALRRIPQLHQAMQKETSVWDYRPVDGQPGPGKRGAQLGDDLRFANGTVFGKRVRVAGLGNIASRYAQWLSSMGADVAAWDPFAPEPVFHRTGARRRQSLDALVRDADIFAPMLPLRPETEGIVQASHLEALPPGCLVVLVTRTAICHMPTLRERVLADELSLAADVHDREPLPFDDPLLGRHNVVHTPHNAGRTVQANHSFAQGIFDLLFPDAT